MGYQNYKGYLETLFTHNVINEASVMDLLKIMDGNQNKQQSNLKDQIKDFKKTVSKNDCLAWKSQQTDCKSKAPVNGMFGNNNQMMYGNGNNNGMFNNGGNMMMQNNNNIGFGGNGNQQQQFGGFNQNNGFNNGNQNGFNNMY